MSSTPISQKSSTEEFAEELDDLNHRLEAAEQLNLKLDKLAILLQKYELGDILLNYTSPRRLLFTNFLAGLSRGLGLTIGTAIVLALLGWILSHFVSVPIIGEYVSKIVDYVHTYKMMNENN